MSIIKEFFGIGGYTREPEGYMSWEHLTFVTSLIIIMVICAVVFGRKNRFKDENLKNRVLIAAALLIDGFEIIKIVMSSVASKDPMQWTVNLPLFLCSIQLITIPLAAFSKGRIKEASLDFVTIFGLLGALLGTYFAGNNYGSYPVISADNVISGITHCISGFTALYIVISGMASMKKKNIVITMGILGGFCVSAYIANMILDYNYMFLVRGDGTPYDIVYNLVGGHPVLYPLSVVALFVVYIAAYYYIYYAINSKIRKKELVH